MSFLQILPEELTAAAAQLQTVGTSLTAQNAAAAMPTTAIAPAALDEVSALQAALFAAYGTYYQEISAEAQAMHDMFVNTLGISAGTYAATEDFNSAAAASPFSGLGSAAGAAATPFNGLTAEASAIIQATTAAFPAEFSGGIANIANIGAGNWASATSTLVGLAGGGLLPAEEAAEAASELGGEAALAELGELGAAEAAVGGGAIAAGLGEASAVGMLSVPPSWAGAATLVSSTAPAALSGAGWTAAAPAAAPATFLPGGLASAARNSAGFGAPRYGVKPIVMPKPAVV
ncbi:PE domain-containing protein [Mycobacterium shinjukuense]|uniref:PE family protein n=1 Tax=Mycobacterium shinjukuense TaxID=398694 RepID=A0A7I7MJK2_9MYCO|nr:PE domain-containing protein [Mycobacterium shinjukuense]MCV6985749.1 PE domain-containing protein [Mycobacterium shinjukuense]ORB61855.1 PE family protein [Mycobacterium shinjukuense]BBX72336.1 PE family protein [Mycobacterium shinjukuense]